MDIMEVARIPRQGWSTVWTAVVGQTRHSLKTDTRVQGREATGTSKDRVVRRPECSPFLDVAMLLLVLVIHKRDPDFRLTDQGVFHEEYSSTAIFNMGLFVCLINANHCYEA